ncbi:N-alpha-acetyltransferase 80 isoform X1 [Colletes latitarsis]|uniref:N-alpha-acetyltransferase 80 isoform X1 n=2 Tax=Colletes latitarsis TaxID=2605962 RepID=UPI00403564B9
MTTIDREYVIVPIHLRQDLIQNCCTLLNSEWPRSESARLKSLNESCDDFPTCLILIDTKDSVLGHCKILLFPRVRHSCFIQSVIIDYRYRSQGLGSRLLQGVEEYVAKKGIKNVCLITEGQEVFYLKNGYKQCDPFKACGINDVVYSTAAFTKAKLKEKCTQYSGPPPPPMPNFQVPKFFDLSIIAHKTYMMKKLSS